MRTDKLKPARSIMRGSGTAIAAVMLSGLAFATPGAALAACGGGAIAGAHGASGSTGIHSGASVSHGSSGGVSCGVSASTGGAGGSASSMTLAGVHAATRIVGNGNRAAARGTATARVNRASHTGTGGHIHP